MPSNSVTYSLLSKISRHVCKIIVRLCFILNSIAVELDRFKEQTGEMSEIPIRNSKNFSVLIASKGFPIEWFLKLAKVSLCFKSQNCQASEIIFKEKSVFVLNLNLQCNFVEFPYLNFFFCNIFSFEN